MAIYLSNDEIEALLTPAATLQALRTALRDYGLGQAQNTPRIRLDLEDGLFRSMMAVIPALDATGLKQGMWLSSEMEGATKDVERRTELVSLYSLREKRLLAIIGSSRMNELRTAAAAAVAAEQLAREDSTTVGVVGTGPHAVAQVELLTLVRPLTRVRVFSRKPENRARFVEKLRGRTSLEAEQAASAAEAVRDADIVVEATFSRAPVLTAEMISAGTHVNSIGSSFAGKQVLADSLLSKVGCFCVDFKEQALRDGSGDVLGGVARGIRSYDSVVSLGDLVAGLNPGRTSRDEITLYKSLGMGLFDVAAAHAAWKLASERGLGTELHPIAAPAT